MSVKTNTEDQKNTLVLAILYTIIIGLGMYISLHWAGYEYGNFHLNGSKNIKQT